MAMGRWISGERTVYVDLGQVGFLRPAPADAFMQAANLGVIWRNALSRGATRLIANGMVTTNQDPSRFFGTRFAPHQCGGRLPLGGYRNLGVSQRCRPKIRSYCCRSSRNTVTLRLVSSRSSVSWPPAPA
jgi:hypothetical protein